jgi:FkbM family methyltransferase
MGKRNHNTRSSADLEKRLESEDRSRRRRQCDVGGNLGDWTGALLSLCNPNQVYIFEPSSVNQSKISSRFAGHEKVKLMPFALSDHDGTAELFSNVAGSGIASLYQKNIEHLGIEYKPVESIEKIAFETFLNNEKIGFIDILKLDIEGHEFSVLKAIPSHFWPKIRSIQFEFDGCNISSRTYFQDFWYLLHSNYDFYRVSPLGLVHVPQYRELDKVFTTTNFLCVKKSSI